MPLVSSTHCACISFTTPLHHFLSTYESMSSGRILHLAININAGAVRGRKREQEIDENVTTTRRGGQSLKRNRRRVCREVMTDAQNPAASARAPTHKAVEMPGIEPGASRMQSERSTTELHPRDRVISPSATSANFHLTPSLLSRKYHSPGYLPIFKHASPPLSTITPYSWT